MSIAQLRARARRYRKLKAELAVLETEIRDGYFATQPGLLMKPRVERIIELVTS